MGNANCFQMDQANCDAWQTTRDKMGNANCCRMAELNCERPDPSLADPKPSSKVEKVHGGTWWERPDGRSKVLSKEIKRENGPRFSPTTGNSSALPLQGTDPTSPTTGSSDLRSSEIVCDTTYYSDSSDMYDISDIEMDPLLAVGSMDAHVIDMHTSQIDPVEIYGQISQIKRDIAKLEKLVKQRESVYEHKKQQLEAAQIEIVLKGASKWTASSQPKEVSRQLVGEAKSAQKLLKTAIAQLRSSKRILGHFMSEYRRNDLVNHLHTDSPPTSPRDSPIGSNHVAIGRKGLVNHLQTDTPVTNQRDSITPKDNVALGGEPREDDRIGANDYICLTGHVPQNPVKQIQVETPVKQVDLLLRNRLAGALKKHSHA